MSPEKAQAAEVLLTLPSSQTCVVKAASGDAEALGPPEGLSALPSGVGFLSAVNT